MAYKPKYGMMVPEYTTMPRNALATKTRTAKTVTAIAGTPISPPVSIPNAAVNTIKNATGVQAPVTNDSTKKKFGKTIVGKVLKVAAIAGGSVLGLGAIIGGVTGAASGAGVLAGAIGGVSKIVKTVGGGFDKVGTAAVNLITGTTKDERKQVREVKAEGKAAANQLEQVDRLIKAGATADDARNLAGVPAAEMTEYDGKPIIESGFNTNTMLIIAGAAAALLILPKLFKSRR